MVSSNNSEAIVFRQIRLNYVRALFYIKSTRLITVKKYVDLIESISDMMADTKTRLRKL